MPPRPPLPKRMVPKPYPDAGTILLSLLRFDQIFAEEGEDFCIELLMESNAIKACHVLTKLWFAKVGDALHKFRAARWKEGKMPGIWHDTIIWLNRQVLGNRCGILG